MQDKRPHGKSRWPMGSSIQIAWSSIGSPLTMIVLIQSACDWMGRRCPLTRISLARRCGAPRSIRSAAAPWHCAAYPRTWWNASGTRRRCHERDPRAWMWSAVARPGPRPWAAHCGPGADRDRDHAAPSPAPGRRRARAGRPVRAVGRRQPVRRWRAVLALPAARLVRQSRAPGTVDRRGAPIRAAPRAARARALLSRPAGALETVVGAAGPALGARVGAGVVAAARLE